jgi:hypothetical protein
LPQIAVILLEFLQQKGAADGPPLQSGCCAFRSALARAEPIEACLLLVGQRIVEFRNCRLHCAQRILLARGPEPRFPGSPAHSLTFDPPSIRKKVNDEKLSSPTLRT